MAITSAGVGSGLDVDSLITQLMTIEKRPLTLLDKKEASYQSKLSAYGTLKSSLSSLQTAAKSLSTIDKFSPMKSSVADTTVLTAAPTSSAVAGSYNVEVQSLAQSQKLMSGGYAATTSTVGKGTLTFDFGSYATDGGGVTSFTANTAKPAKTVTIDATNNTLAGVRDAINKANIGVTASIINDGTTNGYRLMVSSNDTGARNALKIGVVENGAAGLGNLAYDATTGGTSVLSQTVAAKDAVIKVDNVTITKPSNVVTDAIQGVTLTLTKEMASGTTTKLTLSRDTSSVQSAIEGFVKAYNSTLTTIKDSTAFNTATGVGAVLNGDSMTRSVQSQLRGLFSTPILGAATGTAYLSDIGITFQRDGSLGIDSTKLSSALADPARDVSRLFATTDTGNGYAYQMDTVIGKILSPVGMLAGSTASLNTSIKNLDKQRDAINLRLDASEKRYRAQFTALDSMVASMQKTSSFLTQQLASMASSA
jgi:flagellar hook-associated protein 2